jgi:hypothetical protein
MPNSAQPGRPRFCGHCGAELPPGNPRFCIACGGALHTGAPGLPSAPEEPTVQLPNARVAQSVVGGTVRLPTSGAIPSGLWLQDAPPAAADVIAVYAPLRAVVGGWSGLAGMGWRRDGQTSAAPGGTTMLFSFTATRRWFPAPGCGAGLHMEVQLRAQAEADEGHERRGFRYRTHHDPPMEVAAARWLDPSTGARVERPLPQIQIMAPPRVRRVSDYDETIGVLPDVDAEAWSREGQVHGQFELTHTSQQRTPAGRGLPLVAARSAWSPVRLLRGTPPLYRVQAFAPLMCRWPDWPQLQQRMQADARELGLDLETDAVVEWWLDRQGHDCVVFEGAGRLYNRQRAVIAFRRSQIARCAGDINRPLD